MNDSEVGCEDTVYKLVGFDSAGVRRVWASDYSKMDAERRCLNEAADYVRSRPDTGPLTSWYYEWR
jgi:hypothetical protein